MGYADCNVMSRGSQHKISRAQTGSVGAFSVLGRANSTRKILIRAEVITARLKRPTDQLENDIAPALPTSGKNLMLPEEHLMGWAMAEMQCLIHPGDANMFAGYTKHRNLRDDFYRAGVLLMRRHGCQRTEAIVLCRYHRCKRFFHYVPRSSPG